MNKIEIKSIDTFFENDLRKTKMVITENDCDKEIILEGNGSVKVAVEV